MSSRTVFIFFDPRSSRWRGMNLTRRKHERFSTSTKFRDWLVILLLFALPAGAAPSPDDADDYLRQRLEQLTTAEVGGGEIRYAAPSVLQAYYQTRDFKTRCGTTPRRARSWRWLKMHKATGSIPRIIWSHS